MFDSKIFGENIKKLRTNENISIYQLSIIIDTGESNLSKIESGKKTPTAKLAVALVNYFNVSINDCLESDGINRDIYFNKILNNLSCVNSQRNFEFLYKCALYLKMLSEGREYGI